MLWVQIPVVDNLTIMGDLRALKMEADIHTHGYKHGVSGFQPDVWVRNSPKWLPH